MSDLLREGLPDAETSGVLPEMRDDIEATRALTPDWMKLSLPDMQGPFNIAHMVLGDEAFIAPITEPDEWKEFMTIVTEFFIAMHQTLTRWIGPERLDTHPSRYHRIAECNVNLVSKTFYLEHVLEYDQRIADYFGEVAIHPCSSPHVFHATLDSLPNVVCTQAGNMLNPMAVGSTGVEKALTAIGDRPIMLELGEELPAGEEEATMRRLFDLAAGIPRIKFVGFTGLDWLKGDETAMLEMHRRMNDYYTSVARDSIIAESQMPGLALYRHSDYP